MKVEVFFWICLDIVGLSQAEMRSSTSESFLSPLQFPFFRVATERFAHFSAGGLVFSVAPLDGNRKSSSLLGLKFRCLCKRMSDLLLVSLSLLTRPFFFLLHLPPLLDPDPNMKKGKAKRDERETHTHSHVHTCGEPSWILHLNLVNRYAATLSGMNLKKKNLIHLLVNLIDNLRKPISSLKSRISVMMAWQHQLVMSYKWKITFWQCQVC